jgi:hypothetical protein
MSAMSARAGAFVDQIEAALDAIEPTIDVVEPEVHAGEIDMQVGDFAFDAADAFDQFFLAVADRRDVGADLAQHGEDQIGAVVAHRPSVWPLDH